MDAVARQLAKAQRALDLGRADEALAIGREVVRKHSRSASALHFVGRVYCAAGKASLGLPYLRRAAAVEPNDAAIALALGHALGESGLVDEAIDVVRAAESGGWECECDSSERASSERGSVDGQMLLGDLYRRVGALAEAHGCFGRVVDLLSVNAANDGCSHGTASQLAAAHNNAANTLFEMGRREEAIADYRRAIELAPMFADAWANLAAALFAADQFAAATEAAHRAVALSPRLAPAWLTLGNALSERGAWAEARRAFDALLVLEPLSHAARYNRSLARLALGEWSAWDDYRLRHVVEPTIAFASGLPRWNGESLAGRTILVRREQGIGTQVMFSGYLPALANLADRVLVECDRRLKPLFSRTLPGVDFAASGEIFATEGEDQRDDGVRDATNRPTARRWRVAKPDMEVAIGDLPGLLRRCGEGGDWNDLVSPPRLKADADLVRKWRGRLTRIGGGLHVGISWRGGSTTSARQKRSTTLDQWSPVLAVSGVEFVSLQYGDVSREITEHAARGGKPLRRWDDFDPRDDLDDLVALVAALDLVVSIDNSTVHLAGAIGAPVWVLLPAAADWRWQEGCRDSPWYPSTELLRADRDGEDWPALFANAAERLGQFVRERRLGTSHAG